MKILAVNSELCIGCARCEEVCSKAYFKEEDRDKSAIIVEVNEDSANEITVCNQCGECIEVCPTQAIYRDKNGVVRINKKECVGCLSCVGFCPTSAMRYYPNIPEPFKCIACGLCARECPTEAIYLTEVE